MAANTNNGKNRSSVPLRGCAVENLQNANWREPGLTVAGGNGKGRGFNQLNGPYGLYIDDDLTIYVADCANHRIMKWKHNSTCGEVVAGGNGQGFATNQLRFPNDIILDKEQDCLIISDRGNRRIVKWPCRGATAGTTIISDIDCIGVTMDESGALYLADHGQHVVKKYRRGDTSAIIVAGGNGKGAALNQLSSPGYIFVDREHSVYVSEWDTNRVTKWNEGSTQGIIVAGGNGQGSGYNQLSRPLGIIVDQIGTVYVADTLNDRIMRWSEGSSNGSVIIDRNRDYPWLSQLCGPEALTFDLDGNIYVVDKRNSRVQKFPLLKEAHNEN